jgi:uncharacterized protein YuzE
MAIRLTYDARTDVAYLRFRETSLNDVMGPALILEKDWAFNQLVIADFRLIDGALVGFEFLGASEYLPAELLATAERIDGENANRRFGERIVPLLRHGLPEPGKRTKH